MWPYVVVIKLCSMEPKLLMSLWGALKGQGREPGLAGTPTPSSAVAEPLTGLGL